MIKYTHSSMNQISYTKMQYYLTILMSSSLLLTAFSTSLSHLSKIFNRPQEKLNYYYNQEMKHKRKLIKLCLVTRTFSNKPFKFSSRP
jgi:hypothetical protein